MIGGSSKKMQKLGKSCQNVWVAVLCRQLMLRRRLQ